MGFQVFTPLVGAEAQVLVSGSNTWILACGDGAVDSESELGTVYAYCYQSISSIPTNPPSGAASVGATGLLGSWQIDEVPGATCGPAPNKMQTNYLALWVTYPSTPQVSTYQMFKGACNGTTTDTCGSGSGDVLACGIERDRPAVVRKLAAKVFGKAGIFRSLPADIELAWKPAILQWVWQDEDQKVLLSSTSEGGPYQLLVEREKSQSNGKALAQSTTGEPLHLIFQVALNDVSGSAFTADIAEA